MVPLGEVQKPFEPLLLGVPKGLDASPPVCPAKHRTDGDKEDVDERVVLLAVDPWILQVQKVVNQCGRRRRLRDRHRFKTGPWMESGTESSPRYYIGRNLK
jgi:hypothetical protein